MDLETLSMMKIGHFECIIIEDLIIIFFMYSILQLYILVFLFYTIVACIEKKVNIYIHFYFLNILLFDFNLFS